jgi:adenylate kinase
MIILFGVVGSGKSEQANLLEQKLHCPHVTVSQLIRQQANPVWDKLMLAGQLVPDDDVLPLIDREFKRINAAQKEFILDGAPRSIGQAEWLSNKIKAGEVKLTAIFHLKVSRETTLKRLLKRGREDDKAEIIIERFRQYEQITSPVLDYLRSQGFKILDLDGEWSADVVERQIWHALGDKGHEAEVR